MTSFAVKAVLKRDFPSLTDWKTFECLTESLFDENARNFQELLIKVWGIECCFSFLSKCVSVTVEKTNDDGANTDSRKTLKNAEIGSWGLVWHDFLNVL